MLSHGYSWSMFQRSLTLALDLALSRSPIDGPKDLIGDRETRGEMVDDDEIEDVEQKVSSVIALTGVRSLVAVVTEKRV